MPKGVTLDDVFQTILSFRAAFEGRAVLNKFGREAFDAIYAEMLRLYVSKINPEFVTLMIDAERTINRADSPAEWIGEHCTRLLQTSDPKDEAFHMSVGHCCTMYESIISIVEREANV